ncbi:carbohydrate sulfotransferase 3-like [Palaemon carinicauda]|uniref:carbohydrate sulfotransferase 3-like n=1 Tax=Palaemon carinicauda TaxID=392227 RepID=UPI0035B581FB
MILRKQHIILVAVVTFIVLSYFPSTNPNIESPKTEQYELDENRLVFQEKSLNQILSAIDKLSRRVDALASQTKDTQPNPKAMIEQRKMEELEHPHEDFEVRGEEGRNVDEDEMSIESNYPDEIVNGRLMSSKGEPVKVIVLVGSTARSGTSFLGELLSQFDNVLYLFEPELYIRAKTREMVSQETGIPLLKDMIYCRISNEFAQWLKTRSSSSNIFRHPVTKLNCRNWSSCLVPSRLQNACREEHIRVMKVIRIRMMWMRPLLDDPQVDLKVIHLVRDPRGSLYSMAKNQLHKLDPGYYCPLIEDDILQTPKLMQEYPGKVMGITYEQLCLDPIGKATEIWRFLVGENDAELSPKWAAYMESHVSRAAEKRRVAVYGTVRNTTEQYQAWRTAITERALLEIEANCQSVLSKLGYNLFGTLERARNISYPLFVDHKKSV